MRTRGLREAYSTLSIFIELLNFSSPGLKLLKDYLNNFFSPLKCCFLLIKVLLKWQGVTLIIIPDKGTPPNTTS